MSDNTDDATPSPDSGQTKGVANSMEKIREKLHELTLNYMVSRAALYRGMSDPRRDINHECGYPEGPSTAEDYQKLYEEESIAARVVQVLPKESWQVQPVVYEKERSSTPTSAFDKGVLEMCMQLRGEQSYFRGEEGNPLWEILLRGDILSGIGRYGALLIGIDDGRQLKDPALFKPGPTASTKILYIRAFSEANCQILRFESDPFNPRFGQPTAYQITLNDPAQTGQTSATGVTTATMEVHWTRIVHLADNLESSEVFGVSRMRAGRTKLLDLHKLYGGSAEMYWRGALPGWAFETNPNLGTSVKVNEQKHKDMVEDWANGLQRYLTLIGMSAKSLAPQVVDPTPQITVQIEGVCIQLGVPVRIFKGSERGELASNQDDAAWNDRLRHRQKNYITPRIICPVIDRCIALGVLPVPADGYQVWWPDMGAQTAMDVASVALTKTQALVQYAAGGGDALMAPIDFLTRILGMSEEEANIIIRNIDKYLTENPNGLMADDMLDDNTGPAAAA